MNQIYLDLTKQFNDCKLRAIICSGQAVVLHRLAIMSKDGDWILKEDEESLRHVLGVLSRRKAHYRFGAPLDIRWMSGGWSSHLEFGHERLRVRTDFFTRPPRISPSELPRLFAEQESSDPPFVGLVDLARMKKTNREKDYVVIGELARRMSDVRDQLRYSRSARDIEAITGERPDLAVELVKERPVLSAIPRGRSALEAALDAERRELIHLNEARLEAYRRSASRWSEVWAEVQRETDGMDLLEAHEHLVKRAESALPLRVDLESTR
jgi:hypothetical protein